MAEQAKVTSVEAVETFRARLIVYQAKARAAVEECSSEVHRLRQWLQGEQRNYWEEQVRLRRRKLERAQGELSSARLSSLQEAGTAQLMAVRRAKEQLAEAEAKLAILKKWDRELENRTEPLLRQTFQLQHTLNNDLPKAAAYLAQTVKTLDAYADISTPRLGGETGSSHGTSTAAGEPPAAAPNPEENS